MTRRSNPLLWAASAALCAGTVGVAVPVLADSSRVISVEEHWELHLSQPDAERSAPQTTMVMSPSADVAGVHFLFTLNHQAVPNYQAGGMQVQVWDGEELSQEKVGQQSGPLQNEDETVSWVQRISLESGTLKFAVSNGESQSWGEFGGDDLTLSLPTTLTTLNTYRPAVSLSESQVSYAENRVTSLTLKKLVWVTDDGQVHEQNAPIPIDTTLGD
jgi:hypothetical protein